MTTSDERARLDRALGIVGAKFPAKAKLLANLEQITAEDRARAGITDEQANAMVSSNNPPKLGIVVERGPMQLRADEDVIPDYVRVMEYTETQQLCHWSGTAEQYARFLAAMKGETIAPKKGARRRGR